MRRIAFAIIFLLCTPLFAFAGTINSTNKYARFLSDNTLINFGATNGSVTVTSSALTGYAWGSSVGWINLSPANGGITNNGEGVLNGYAWGENTGWVNFKPTNGGVTIDSTGTFNGYAWSESKGWIVFNCATDSTCGTLSHKVQTDWAPTAPGGGGGGGGGGAYVPPPAPEPTPEPIPSTPAPEPLPPSLEPVVPPPSLPPATEAPPLLSSPLAPEAPSAQTQSTSSGGGWVGSTVSAVSTTIENVSEQIANLVINIADVVTEISIVAKENIKEGVLQTKKVATEVRKDAKETLETPAGAVTSKTVTTVGVVTGGATSFATLFFTQAFSIKDLVFLPAQLWGLLLSAFGIKRRHRPWGTVYDSITKQPLDPAYIELKTLDGKDVATAFTDLDGRYGFIAPPGTYRIVANKTNYKFPSMKLTGKTEDEFYTNLYFGDTVTFSEGSTLLARDIPMDPEGFDWNEYAKRSQKLMGFYSRNTIFIERLSRWLFIVGFIITLFVLLVDPQPYSIAICVLYVLVWVLRKVGPGDHPHGVVIDKETGIPFAFGVVKVSHPNTNIVVRNSITDALGRYYCLVTKGTYNVAVMRKEKDGTYSSLDFSKTVDASRGIIREKFEV